VKNTVHFIFSTKHREPFIQTAIQSDLHAYLFDACKNLGCNPVRVGGDVDHVYILCALSKKFPIMKLLEMLKAHSSKWIKTKGDAYQRFYWQDGYAAFSVSPWDVDKVVTYIDNQKEHHRHKSFRDELKDLLAKHQMECGERYLWD
jgi:putative transposase